jgi:predicted site-specific integrase-resolvase
VPYARVQECVLPLGAKHLEAALEAQGRRIVVVDASKVDDDLVRGDDLSVPVHGGACQRAAS